MPSLKVALPHYSALAFPFLELLTAQRLGPRLGEARPAMQPWASYPVSLNLKVLTSTMKMITMLVIQLKRDNTCKRPNQGLGIQQVLLELGTNGNFCSLYLTISLSPPIFFSSLLSRGRTYLPVRVVLLPPLHIFLFH